ncbi:MAG: ferrochelatase [Acidobacteriota bacterium]|nr:ferrochelatase [Acidobacteriota bacterium]
MSETAKTAVLLLAHGSPDRPQDVPEFLKHVTGGRPLPAAAVEEIQRRYARIGRSPLTEITVRQAALLARELKLPVYVGMRNWTPFIADVLQQMSADGVQRVVALCLAPQNSRTSVGLYRQAAMTMTEGGPRFQHFEFVEAWHDHPLLIRAFAEKLGSGWEQACDLLGARVPILFTAHSVPSRTILEGDPYETQARETAALVAMALPALTVEDWSFAFQSQGQGTSGGPWIGPTVEDTIPALKKKGHGGVFLQPIGFVCDHVEVLYDIDVAFHEFAARQGMRLWRAESLNDSSTFIAALADVVRSRLGSDEPAKPLVQIAKPQ